MSTQARPVQPGQPGWTGVVKVGLGSVDRRQDLSERDLSVPHRAQVAAGWFGTGRVMRPLRSSSTPWMPRRRACMAYLVS